MREVEGELIAAEGAAARGLAARTCEPRVPPEPEPVPVPAPDPELPPAAASPLPEDAPREWEKRFEPGCPESVEAQGLEAPPSSACLPLYEWLLPRGGSIYGVISEPPAFERFGPEFELLERLKMAKGTADLSPAEFRRFQSQNTKPTTRSKATAPSTPPTIAGMSTLEPSLGSNGVYLQ